MKSGRQLLISLAVILFIAAPGYAQDGEAKLVDEVIARINANVIMRSAFEQAQKERLEDMKRRNLKPEEIEKEFAKLRPELLDELINKQLIVQRAKDLSINVDAQVNQQILRIMKENNCESQECLGQKMRDSGLTIDDVKRILGERFMYDAVIGREVYHKRIREVTEKDKRDAFEKNKSMFVEPAEVKFSRIFIAFGTDAAAAATRAENIAKQAKNGTIEFSTLASNFSEEPLGKSGGTMAEAIKVSDLLPDLKPVIEKAPKGSVTDPVKLEGGYYIFKIDERKEEVQLTFDNENVQEGISRMIVGKHAEKDIEEFLAKLRDEAFIEIDTRYQFETAKVKSAEIKRVQFMDEKERKQLDKEKKKAEELKKKQEKTAAPIQKTAKNN